ncbi:MAG: glycosyltransferase [Marinilabiliales bacterium]|nr:MAG: glycosyltransferase [Marinilabiliales bacterium]
MKLAIVIPCFNEQEVLPEIAKRLKELLQDLIKKNKISESSYILFVDDGSTDETWSIIAEFHQNDKLYNGIKLARNVGHQNALLSGLHLAKNKCDAVISIDADLQDDIGVIEEMIDKYQAGSEIVYGVRSSRKTDTIFKRATAKIFYRIMLFLGVRTVYEHADFRLLSNKVLLELAKFREKNLFLRGIVPLIGFKSEKVYYKRGKRFAGKTKYPFSKMIKFAMDGITSFSVRPMRMIFMTGIVILFISFLSFIYIMISYFRGGNIAGWTSTMISLWFLGSLTIISLGIIGEYIGKIYSEVKDRPLYNVEETLLDSSKE